MQNHRMLNPERSMRVLTKLLKDPVVKRVADREKLSLSAVYDVKKRYPLFFWKPKQKP